MKPILSILFFLSVLTVTFGQKQDQEVGITIGLINYQGDLAQGTVNAQQTNVAFGAQYRTFLSSKFALKGALQLGKISGSDLDYNLERGISMENQLLEVVAQAEWHPLGLTSFEESGAFVRNFTPYLGLGLGVVFTNEEISTIGSNLKPEEDSGSLIIVPIDLGIRFAVTPSFSATLKAGTRATFSDLLDGVSENGNADANDWYLIGGLGLQYTW